MLSVIICTYNRDKYIYQTLRRVAENKFSTEYYEVILINNNSTDNTAAECERFRTNYPDIDYKYIVETKQGLSHARNRGIQESKGDVLIFLDDDSFVNDNYLSQLQQYVDNYEDMTAFGGKITPLFEDGIIPKWMSKWNYSWVSAIDKGNQVCLFSGSKYPIGANMGFKRICVEKFGYFNTNLGRTKKNLMGGEEKDYFNRIKDAGLKIYYFPEISIQHVIPPSRTTEDYIKKLGYGIGVSEYFRCKDLGVAASVKRFVAEIVKWCATLALLVYYTIIGRFCVGKTLLIFRKNVTCGFLKGKIQ